MHRDRVMLIIFEDHTARSVGQIFLLNSISLVVKLHSFHNCFLCNRTCRDFGNINVVIFAQVSFS